MVENDATEEWIEDLNQSVSGGGGCAEAWEAAENQRNTGRRTFLAGVLGSLLTGVSATKALAAGSEDIAAGGELETKIVELDGRARENAIANLLSDTEAREIRNELVAQGSRPNRPAAEAYRVRYQEQVWEVVNLPYTTPDRVSNRSSDSRTNVNAGVTWSSRDDYGAVGFIEEASIQPHEEISSDVEEAIEQNNINYSPENAQPVSVSLTTLTTGDTGVKIETNSRTVPLEEPSGSTIAPAADLSDCACTAVSSLCVPCGTPDWGCINTLAGAYAAEIGACSVCAYEPTKLTCIPCISAVVEQLASGETPICCYCDAFSIPNPF